ncbi:MAG: hypothetical protein ACFE9T_04420 [Promethearchaeota archaeon]
MKKKRTTLLLFFVILFIVNINLIIHLSNQNNFSIYNNKTPELSFFKWATLELTNPSEIDGQTFSHNSIITIEGRIYNKADETNKSGIEVIIQVDGIDDPSFNDFTDSNGRFAIDYTIDPSLDVYSSHEIKALPINYVTVPPGGYIENPDFYTININTTSYFEIISDGTDDPSIPKLTEEYFRINGFLRDGNDDGIPSEMVAYYWLDGSNIIDNGIFWSGASGGLSDIQVPNTLLSQLTLKLNFSNPPYIGYSEISRPLIKVFSGVTWNLDLDPSTYERAQYAVSGQLSSITDSSLKINDREVIIIYNGSEIDRAYTNSEGRFTSTFRIPDGIGTAYIEVQLNNDAAKYISSGLTYIFVDVALTSDGGPSELPPFLIFSIIFFPILAVIIIGLIVYALRYYRKQEEQSRVVNVPLVSKIKNLKILKDSGRLEESLSYLFNAIYMDLVNAKYSRTRKENETIRDFAIVSVKDLKLTPAAVYPFIQKIEEIIYAKPFKITEIDFYKTCELFSPIYFQLTGYNFVLNF